MDAKTLLRAALEYPDIRQELPIEVFDGLYPIAKALKESDEPAAVIEARLMLEAPQLAWEWEQIQETELPSEEEARELLQVAKQMAILRRGANYANSILAAASRGDVKQVQELVGQNPLDGEMTASESPLLPVEEAAKMYFERITSGYLNKSPIRMDLAHDSRFHWWDGHRLITVMAETGHGKSTFLLNAALSTIEMWHEMQHNSIVAYVALEGGYEMLTARMLARTMGIPYNELDPIALRRAPEERQIEVADALAKLAQLPMRVSINRELDDLCNELYRIAEREPVGLIVIDYIQRLTIDHQPMTSEEQVYNAAARLSQIADDLDVVVLAGSQVTPHEGGVNPFRSRAIGFFSTLMLHLVKPQHPDQPVQIECVKNSRGELFKEAVWIDYGTCKIGQFS